MAQELKGHVIDEFGFKIEVWVENEPGGDRPSHVFLMFGGSQLGDFAFARPHQSDPVQVEANRVAAGVAKILTVYPDEVIDPDDGGHTWH